MISLHSQGRYPEAIPSAERLVAFMEEVLAPDHTQVASSLNNLAKLYVTLGRHAEAAATLKELYRINKGRWLTQYELGQIYQDMGRREDAIAAYNTFLGGWSEADEGLAQLVDAKRQMTKLRRNLQ